MAKQFVLIFNTGNPSGCTGLTPTLIVFKNVPGGSNLTAPAISEIPTSTGIYTFPFSPTLPIAFVCDGGATLSTSERYIRGVLDPIQAVDDKVGFGFDSFGSTSVDPTTVLGYAKRNIEFQEGNATFDKTTGAWDISSRGSSTLLRVKTLQNVSGDVTKS